MDVLLVSFDIVGLYPHIPHEVGMEIIKEFLKQREVKDISTKRLCDLVAIVLKNSIFETGEEAYHQLLGTTIETKFVPTYAILFVARLEKKTFENTNFKTLLWLPYLDDIYCILTEGFYQYLSSFHPTIKFTMEF